MSDGWTDWTETDEGEALMPIAFRCGHGKTHRGIIGNAGRIFATCGCAPSHAVEIAAATVAPIRPPAELFSADEETARRLIAARVTCFDISAVVATAIFAAKRRRAA